MNSSKPGRGMTSVNNNTTLSAAVRDYSCVHFIVSTVSFSVLLFFNLIINFTIVRVEHLRSHARFVLVFHLLLSALLHLGTSSVFYYQNCAHVRPGRSVCIAMITILISSGSNILLTLTAMALDRYCAVCHPMRYTASFAAWYCSWLVGALTWLVALLIPLSLLTNLDSQSDNNGACRPEQLKKGNLQKVLFISACALLILYSYGRILVEGRKLGVLNRRNRAGCRTIALHFSQLAVFILPNFVNFALTVTFERGLIQAETKGMSAVVIFAFFSLAQCVAPVVYGLRKQELVEKLSHQFPCCSRYLKRVLGWIVRVSWTHSHYKTRERTLTVLEVLEVDDEAEMRSVPVMGSSHDLDSRRGDLDDA